MIDQLPVLTPRLICSSSTDAIEFYTTVFGAKELERYTSPDGVVVHAALAIRGSVISLADAAPAWGNYSPDLLNGSPVLMSLTCDDPDAIARSAEKNGATIVMPVEDRFYGQREGRIRDPFGHLWILTREIRKMTAGEIQRGVDNFDIDRSE